MNIFRYEIILLLLTLYYLFSYIIYFKDELSELWWGIGGCLIIGLVIVLTSLGSKNSIGFIFDHLSSYWKPLYLMTGFVSLGFSSMFKIVDTLRREIDSTFGLLILVFSIFNLGGSLIVITAFLGVDL